MKNLRKSKILWKRFIRNWHPQLGGDSRNHSALKAPAHYSRALAKMNLTSQFSQEKL